MQNGAEHGMKSELRNGILGDVRDASAQLVHMHTAGGDIGFGSSCVMARGSKGQGSRSILFYSIAGNELIRSSRPVSTGSAKSGFLLYRHRAILCKDSAQEGKNVAMREDAQYRRK
jgi:hypothetical protein